MQNMDLSKVPLKSIFASSIEAVSEAFKNGKIDMNFIIQSAFKKTIVKEVQAGNMQLPGTSENKKELSDGK